MRHEIKLIWLSVFLLGFLCACTSGNIASIYRIDTPVYHVAAGEKMLALKKIDAAHREFSRAADLDPKFSPAYIGLALVHAFRNEFESGLTALDTADRLARGKDQEIETHVGYVRFYTIGAHRLQPDWLDRAEEAFGKAVLIDADDPAAYYYMGLAYQAAGDLDQAAKKFYRVLELGSGYVKAADHAYGAIETGREGSKQRE